jgi:hypothetical protein
MSKKNKYTTHTQLATSERPSWKDMPLPHMPDIQKRHRITRKLSELPTYASSMETSLVSKITEPLHTQYGPLALILQWALASCRDKDSSFHHDLEGLQDDTMYPGYTNFLQAYSDIGWHQTKATMGHTVDPIHRDFHTRTVENYLTKLTISIWNY